MLERDPSEVPAAVAIALADFCRRADRPSGADEVRLALATLPADLDAAVEALCRFEPGARPLSPLAAVDVVRGAEPAQAAAREEEGGYAGRLAELAAEAAVRWVEQAAEERREPVQLPSRRRRTEPVSPQVKSGPVRRTRAEVEARRVPAPAEPEVEAPHPPLPGRHPAAPRFGRFVSSAPVRRPVAELARPEGRAVLEGLVEELRGNRGAILERLAALYGGERGELGPRDLDRFVAQAGLGPRLARLERDNVLALLRLNRGFLPPLARALRLDRAAAKRLVRDLGLEEHVEQLRRRAHEEALAPAKLPDRLAKVVEREAQLRDAGALDALDARNVEELLPALAGAAPSSADPAVVVELARRALGVDPRVWRGAVERYRLVARAAELLGVPAPEAPAAPRPERPPHRGPRAGAPDRRRSPRPFDRGGDRPRADRPPGRGGRPQRREPFDRGGDRPRPPRPFDRGGGDRPPRREARPPGRDARDRPRSFDRAGGGRPPRSFDRGAADRPRPPRSFDRGAADRPRPPRSFDRGATDRPRPPRSDRAGGDRPPRSFDRGAADRPRPPRSDRAGVDRPPRSFDRAGADRPRPPRPFDRAGADRLPRRDGPGDRGGGDRPRSPRPRGPGDRSRPPRTSGERPAGGGGAARRPRPPPGGRPPRGQGRR